MTTSTEALAKELFEVEKLLIGTPIINSGKEGATASYTDIWGDYVWLGFVPSAPGLMTPAAGYIFAWKNRQTNRYREEQEHQDVVECLENWDSVVTSSDSGYLLSDLV